MPRKKSKPVFQALIFLALAAALIYWQYSIMSPEQLSEISRALRNTRWIYLFPALIAGFLSHFLRALRWRLLLEPVGIRTTVKNTTYAVLLGYLANTLIPRLGEVVRCTTLTRYDHAPFDKSLGTVISERLFDTLCLLIIFILVLGMEYDILSGYGNTLLRAFLYDDNGALKTTKILLLSGLGIAVLLIAVLLLKRLKYTRFGQVINSILLGLKSIFLLRKRALFILYSIAIWSLYTVMVWIALKAVPVTSHLGFMPAMAVMAFGSFAIIFTPGGIGAYPPIAAAILSFYNISFAAGTALGWVSWLMQTIVVLILGSLSLILLPLSQKKSNPDDQAGTNQSQDTDNTGSFTDH